MIIIIIIIIISLPFSPFPFPFSFLLKWLTFYWACFPLKNFRESIIETDNFCHGVAWNSGKTFCSEFEFHSIFWAFSCIFQVPLSRSTWSGYHWKDLFLWQKLSTDDAKFNQRWWRQKWALRAARELMYLTNAACDKTVEQPTTQTIPDEILLSQGQAEPSFRSFKHGKRSRKHICEAEYTIATCAISATRRTWSTFGIQSSKRSRKSVYQVKTEPVAIHLCSDRHWFR